VKIKKGWREPSFFGERAATHPKNNNGLIQNAQHFESGRHLFPGASITIYTLSEKQVALQVLQSIMKSNHPALRSTCCKTQILKALPQCSVSGAIMRYQHLPFHWFYPSPYAGYFPNRRWDFTFLSFRYAHFLPG